METPVKESPEQTVQRIKDLIRPDVVNFMNMLSIEPKTTKDNYGTVMGFVSKLPTKNHQRLFLLVMTEEGYPKNTMRSLYHILGLDQ